MWQQIEDGTSFNETIKAFRRPNRWQGELDYGGGDPGGELSLG